MSCAYCRDFDDIHTSDVLSGCMINWPDLENILEKLWCSPEILLNTINTLDREGWVLHRKNNRCPCNASPDQRLMTEKEWGEKYLRGEVFIPLAGREKGKQ